MGTDVKVEEEGGHGERRRRRRRRRREEHYLFFFRQTKKLLLPSTLLPLLIRSFHYLLLPPPLAQRWRKKSFSWRVQERELFHSGQRRRQLKLFSLFALFIFVAELRTGTEMRMEEKHSASAAG